LRKDKHTASHNSTARDAPVHGQRELCKFHSAARLCNSRKASEIAIVAETKIRENINKKQCNSSFHEQYDTEILADTRSNL
jgi:hypothetical protein